MMTNLIRLPPTTTMTAQQALESEMTTGTILFNPFTGRPRHPSDIASDPKGLLIWDGEEPLRAAQPSQAGDAQDAARYRWLQSNAYVGIAPYPKPHEVWCTKLPNPAECSSLDAAIDAAINAKKG